MRCVGDKLTGKREKRSAWSMGGCWEDIWWMLGKWIWESESSAEREGKFGLAGEKFGRA